MTYYADLSKYEYCQGLGSALNVGWLSRSHQFSRGVVPLSFVHELKMLSEEKVENVTRGSHLCEFCQAPIDLIEMDPNYEAVWEMFRSGNGEIHVKGENGVVYSAPTLIVHYIAEHQYQPPQSFISAVLKHREKRQPHWARA